MHSKENLLPSEILKKNKKFFSKNQFISNKKSQNFEYFEKSQISVAFYSKIATL